MTGHVTCIGGGVIDLIYDLDVLPGKDGKYNIQAVSESGGGMAANAAVTVSRLGGQSAWCGRVGDDDKGRRIIEGLKNEGVSVDHCRVYSGAASSHSVVLNVPNGERAILLYQLSEVSKDLDWLPLQSLLETNVVLADNRWIEGATVVLKAAARQGLPRVLDIDSAGSAQSLDFVSLGTHAIYSDPGLGALFEGPDTAVRLQKALSYTDFVAVTRGAAGVDWMRSDGVLRHIPAFAVKAVETVGAGDVFHGAFALKLAEGASEEEALNFAAAASAIKCTRQGGRSSFPSREDVERYQIGVDGAEGGANAVHFPELEQHHTKKPRDVLSSKPRSTT